MDKHKVVITGGAQGLGFGMTKEFLQRGSQVCIIDINSETGIQTQDNFRAEFGEDRIKFIQCDVSNTEQFADAVNQAVQFMEYVDVFINNAGVLDEFNVDRCVAINLTAVIHGTTLAINHMNKQKGGKGGKIINIASESAFSPSMSVPTYCATKSGVVQFTKAWATNTELNSMGISFHVVCPGPTDTAFIQNLEGRVLCHEMIAKGSSALKKMSVERIAEAIMKVIQDNRNGGVLDVKHSSMKYIY